MFPSTNGEPATTNAAWSGTILQSVATSAGNVTVFAADGTASLGSGTWRDGIHGAGGGGFGIGGAFAGAGGGDGVNATGGQASNVGGTGVHATGGTATGGSGVGGAGVIAGGG